MIRECTASDFETIHSIVNDAAQAYKGIIPADRWHDEYMSRDELRYEIDDGVQFWGLAENGQLVGVMGIQDVQDVTLIRHAYVLTARRNQGVGGQLLSRLLVSNEEKDRLLRKYWKIPARQMNWIILLLCRIIFMAL